MISKVWYIDDDPDDRSTHCAAFRELLGSEVEVSPVQPQANIDEFVSSILSDNIDAAILDERLNETSDASYTGMELAKHIRFHNRKLPIYIFTGYIDEISFGEENVEYVIEKDAITDDNKKTKIKARMLRHMAVYRDIYTNQQNRFDELLSKSLHEPLSKEEQTEYNELDLRRSSHILHGESTVADRFEKRLEEQEKILNELKAIKSRLSNE